MTTWTDIFFPGSYFWTFHSMAWGGLLGYLVAVWRDERTLRGMAQPRARINTVWDEKGRVIWDHPIRGLASKNFYETMKSLMFPQSFLSDLVFPKKRRGPPLWRPKGMEAEIETVEFVFNRPSVRDAQLDLEFKYGRPPIDKGTP
ncbi:MAG: hypothetical protein V3S25_11530 [Nitrospirales bacterium]